MNRHRQFYAPSKSHVAIYLRGCLLHMAEKNRRPSAMTKAILYMAPECPHSASVKQFLLDAGLEVVEKNVLGGDDVFEELAEVSGQKAVPVVVVGNDVFVGFDRRIERRMKRKLEG
ncbi:glutaredoxin [Candidatus Thorarchaeota archaeon]|nr:MAG: glutaredoxin [Candidatus Thorarchaeota archaeon]